MLADASGDRNGRVLTEYLLRSHTLVLLLEALTLLLGGQNASATSASCDRGDSLYTAVSCIFAAAHVGLDIGDVGVPVLLLGGAGDV